MSVRECVYVYPSEVLFSFPPPLLSRIWLHCQDLRDCGQFLFTNSQELGKLSFGFGRLGSGWGEREIAIPIQQITLLFQPNITVKNLTVVAFN